MTSVHVVCPGLLRREGRAVAEAHSTATLVLAAGAAILVDTSSRERRDLLLAGLAGAGACPEDIGIVVLTHLHHDHVGNVELFPRARRLAHGLERPGEGIEAVEGGEEIAPGVTLLHTPGHTPGSLSVAARAEDGVYVIAGDAVPTRENHDRWVPPGLNYDPEVALESMARIATVADLIVPGHGDAFPSRRKR
jgi:N-acyl homoserine lactone hydrolase